ncbi:MAG TPA: FAD-dependent oxidoreductase [Thermodesulfobacteriota bacterium]
MTAARIVIIGGGFGGVKCAKELRKGLPSSKYDIVLFNQENHLVFSSLLAEVVGCISARKMMAYILKETSIPNEK